MRRRIVTTLSVTVLLAVPFAGCGQSDKDKYINDYKPLNDKLVTLSNDLAVVVNGASNESNGQVAAKFGQLDGRFTTLGKQIAALSTPASVKDDSKALTDSLARTQKDVAAIAKSAKASDPSSAQAALGNLATDARQITADQNKLAKATGAKISSK